MVKQLFLISLLLFSFKVWSITFEDLSILKFSKEILSENKIRFENKQGTFVHLQVDAFSKLPSDSSVDLNKEVDSMFEMRKSMYKIFGFKNIQLDHFEKKMIQSTPALVLKGSYQRPNNKQIFYQEFNFYLKSNLFQVKILSEKKALSDQEIEILLNQLKISELKL